MKTARLLKEFDIYLQERYLKATATSYRYAVLRFVRHHPLLKKVSLSDVEKYFMELKRKKHQVNYRNTTLAALKVFYDFMLRQNIIQFHPFKTFHIDEKRGSGKDFDAMLNREELEMLFRLPHLNETVLEYRNRSMLGFLVYQGMGSKEVVALHLDDVNLELGQVFIRGSHKNRSRTIALAMDQMEFLNIYLNNERPQICKGNSKYLFLTLQGKIVDVGLLYNVVENLSGFTEKKITPQHIRSSVISYWLNERNMPLEDVQVMAGHRVPSTTEQYISPNVQVQRLALNQLHSTLFGE